MSVSLQGRRAAIEWKREQHSMDLEKQKDNCA
jgi:hypothetical protein